MHAANIVINLHILSHDAGIEMYHVTNQALENNPHEPDWRKIEVHAANDPGFDGKLVGLPVAYFSTTRFKPEKDCPVDFRPVSSPYPRSGDKDKKYWRLCMPFNPKEYTIFEVFGDKPNFQVHLLCLDKTGSGHNFEKVLVEILSKLKEDFPPLDETGFRRYFPNDGANHSTDGFWVNVCFTTPVEIGDNPKWNTVQKTSKHRSPKNCGGDKISLLYKWGEKRLGELQEGCERRQLEREWETSIDKLKQSI